MSDEKIDKEIEDLVQPWDYYPLYPVYAFTSVKKARKFVKNITGKRFEPSGKEGTFTFYEHEDGRHKLGIILLKCQDKTTSQKYAVLAHECIHYTQEFAESITGQPLDDESFAYIAQSAMLACIDQIGEEWFTANPTT